MTIIIHIDMIFYYFSHFIITNCTSNLPRDRP